VAVVSAPAFLQRQRVLRRTGMTSDRMAAIQTRQLPDAEKRRRAAFVIATGLDRRRAIAAIAAIVDAVRGRPGGAWPHRWLAAPRRTSLGATLRQPWQRPAEPLPSELAPVARGVACARS
jgi:hypothetical protein